MPGVISTFRDGDYSNVVDKRIGDAYLVVKDVQKNLPAIITVSEGFAAIAANSAAAIAAKNAADADVVLTNADVVLTHADVVLTNADVVLTNADVVTTTAQAGIATTQAEIATTQAGLATTNGEAQVDLAEAQVALATAQAVIATDQAVLTAADRVQTGLDRTQTGVDVVTTAAARDAALIQAGVYTTEPLGRAAVADGIAFKVQGSGDVAAYEYRRIDASSSTLIATYPSSAALAFVDRSTEAVYVNGNQVMYSVVDSAGRALAYIGMDGVVYGKLPVTASSGIALTRLSDGTYTLKLDAAVIDPSYGATDYLATIVDSAGRMLLTVGFDGTITGKMAVQEVIAARGNRTDLDTRLSQNLTTYGMPKRYTWGEWFLRETRMRLRKRALSETAQLTIAMIGDSWTHAATRYSGVVASTLKTAFGDAGAGWTGFGWGFGGTSSGWSGGNGSASSDMAIALSANWSTHYNSSVSPDIADIYTSTAAAKITATFSGSGNVSAVNLFYIAGGSGNIRYRWNAGAWTALDISAGAGLLTAALASVPTGTWTLEIENVSGTTTLCGLDVQKTTDGVRVHKLGGTGSASSSWTAVNAAYWQAGLTALAPNLVTILLGTNDQGASMTAATYRTNIQTMITRIRAALPVADIALIMPCENQRVANTYAMSVYAKEAYELAAINNCAWLDLQYVFGDTAAQYAYGSARPWFAADLIHPDPTTGGRVITDAVYRLLTTQ